MVNLRSERVDLRGTGTNSKFGELSGQKVEILGQKWSKMSDFGGKSGPVSGEDPAERLTIAV